MLHFFACKKDDTNNPPDYNTLIQGKWLWYKTITTSSQPNKYDTFYNQAIFKQFFANGTVATTHSNGQITNEKYFIINNKLAQIYNSGADTAYSDIINCNSGAFSIYDKITYANVNPPAVVEYWHYFVK
ncbi:MAG: hypothetical protein ACOVO1_03290 [Chitinophagaceae bacterium]